MRIVIEIEEGQAKVVAPQAEMDRNEIPVEERVQSENDPPWYGPPELLRVVKALRDMRRTYTMTWEDRRKEYGRGSYKIRRLFREAEKAGLL